MKNLRIHFESERVFRQPVCGPINADNVRFTPVKAQVTCLVCRKKLGLARGRK